MTPYTYCVVCGKQSGLKCSGCKNVVYCGKEHQKLHWYNGHKEQCRCYEIATHKVLGHYMRAARNIRKGEVILSEPPLLLGPKIASVPICLGCNRILPAPIPPMENYYKCSKCFWPLCSSKCEQAPAHVNECAFMASRFGAKLDFNADSVDTVKKELAYCIILPLRCMLMKERDPEQYQLFDNLEDHLEKRMDTAMYKLLWPNQMTYFKEILGMKTWSDLEIKRIASKVDTNAFTVHQPSTECTLRGIYPTAAMFSHDCMANARHTFDELMKIQFIAKTDIVKGDTISTCYTEPLKCTLMRRKYLAQIKCFDCTCRRCTDPTELGTFCGAIACRECKVGKVVSTEPLNNEADWKCQLCPNKLSANDMTNGNMCMLLTIDQISKTDPPKFEKFLSRYGDVLHATNTFSLQIKYALTQLYGNVGGFRLDEMDNGLLKRKIELCRELLKVADLFDPGSSILRGYLILDLEETLVTLTKREFGQRLISNEDFATKLNGGLQMLFDALEILEHEPGMKEKLLLRIVVISAEKKNTRHLNLHQMQSVPLESNETKNKDKGCSKAEKNVPKADAEEKQSGANTTEIEKQLAKKEFGNKVGMKAENEASPQAFSSCDLKSGELNDAASLGD